MTEAKIVELGFIKQKSYKHDEYSIKRYKKGVLEVEFTYRGLSLLNVTTTIDEDCFEVDELDLNKLDNILNR